MTIGVVAQPRTDYPFSLLWHVSAIYRDISLSIAKPIIIDRP